MTILGSYPHLKKLTVSVRHTASGLGYVNADELHAKLGDEKARQFSDMFGVQTCPIVPGDELCPVLYPWDAEAVLERMESGRLTGSQKHWN